MKVLVVCIPLAGHLNPLKPLIGAFVDAGEGPRDFSGVIRFIRGG